MEPSLSTAQISDATLVCSLVSAAVGIAVGFIMGVRHEREEEQED